MTVVSVSEARANLSALARQRRAPSGESRPGARGAGRGARTAVMRLVFTPNGWADYSSWLKADRRMLPRINRLIEDAMRHPFEGMGKPEPLRHALSGAWSRRITGEHRLVYLVDGDDLVILQARYHYK